MSKKKQTKKTLKQRKGGSVVIDPKQTKTEAEGSANAN